MKRMKAGLASMLVVGMLVAMSMFAVSMANAETDVPLGFPCTNLCVTTVQNSQTHTVFGSGVYGLANAWNFGGWCEESYDEVEIWFTGTNTQGVDCPGFNLPMLVKTGAYEAGDLVWVIQTFFNFISQSGDEHSIVFDTNINGTMEWVGMECCTWKNSIASEIMYLPEYSSYDSSDYDKLVGGYDFFAVCSKTAENGLYEIGVGCDRDTNELEFYFFYQYWDNGVLERVYLDQTDINAYELTTVATAVPIFTSRLKDGKVAIPGKVEKVTGRVYYIGVDSSLDGVHNAGLNVEVPLN